VTPEKAHKMFNETNPLSLIAWYAGLTGVYLYVSGLISGYFDNFCIYARVPERIRRIEFLRRRVPPRTLIKFSNYIEENLGPLADNIYFGIFLGCSTTLGIVIGLPLDTLHVTFSSAGFGIALQTLSQDLSLGE